MNNNIIITQDNNLMCVKNTQSNKKYYCLKDNAEIKFKKRDWQNKKLSPYKSKCIIEYMINV